jgi:hypothetical protein
MIIDCHTHSGIGWQKRSPDDPTEWLKALDRHGIDRAFLYPHLGITRPDVMKIMTRSLAWHHARMVGCCRLSPRGRSSVLRLWPKSIAALKALAPWR